MVPDRRNRAKGDAINSARVLIVDDNVDFAYSLGEILKDEAYQIERAHTGEQAVETFARQDFDIVLLDMKLPRISGVDVLFELRRIKPEVKVIMMSGHSVTDLLSQAVDGGLHRIFYPPYQLDSLLSTLHEMSTTGLVLVVDDDPDLGASIAQQLTAEGHSVLVTEGGPAAVQAVSANAYDYLVLDRQPQVMPGLEVFWELKRAERALPTVIVTPRRNHDYITIEKLNRFPVCGYFIKPFDPLELLPVLERMSRQ